MSARNVVCLYLAAASFVAVAEPPRGEVESANGLLRQGKNADALQAYRNLQIDDPESELLYYNIGCAQLESAEALVDDPTDAIESLTEARDAFNKASMAQRPEIRRDARFNRVNCDSQLAKQLAAAGDHENAVKAFENAIYGYEDFLDQYPDHEGAQKNLGHMRYLLKKMLQNPPEDQEQQQPDQGGDGEDGDQQEQQDQQQQQQNQGGDEQQDGQQGDQSDQQPSDNQNDQQQPGDEQSQQDQQGEGEDQQSGDQSEGKDSSKGDQQAPGENQVNQNEPTEAEPSELPNKETIDAILDALKDRDSQEQQNMRRVPQDPRRSGPWW